MLDYAFARDGKTLAYTVSAANSAENGVYAVTPGSTGAPVAVASGKGKYARLTWSRTDSDLVFSTDRDDQAASSPRLSVYRWTRGTAAAEQLVGFVDAWRARVDGCQRPRHAGILARRPQGLRAHGAATAARAVERSPAGRTRARRSVALARRRHPADAARARQQERARTYRGVYDLAQRKDVQLADLSLRTVTLSDDGTRAIGMDDAPYRRMVDYDGTYNDVYLLDASGARTLLLKRLRERRRTRWRAPVVTRRQVRVLLPGQAMASARRRRADDARRHRLAERRVPRRRR